jgi:small subunit ribosomal protein S1
VENNRGQILLSLKGAASDAKWEYFENALENGTALEAKGIEVNKGGLIAVVNGVRGFVPSSQFSRRYLDHINDLKGKKFKVKAIEVDRERNRLIFSERHVSEEKQLSQTKEALSKVDEGNVYEGVISGVKSFGLFMTVEVPVDGSDLSDKVEEGELKAEHRGKNELPSEDIGYVEGLIHISEISWEKVDHPKNYHTVGDRVLVKVLGVDEKSGKLNLSIKRLKQDPWEKVAEEYPAGTTFTGKVSRIEPFGVFVDVMPGVDGLIHSSKLKADAKFKKGDEVTVNVDSVEPKKRRMSLSMVLTEVPMGYK